MLLFFSAEELPNIALHLKPMLVLIVSFLIFFLLLRMFLFGQIQKILQDREQRFVREWDEVKRLQQELEKKLQEYEQHLARAEEEKREIIRNAMKQAEEYRQEILKKADSEAHAFREKALRNLEMEMESRWKALRQEIVESTFQLAEKLLSEELTEARQKKLVHKFLHQLGDQYEEE